MLLVSCIMVVTSTYAWFTLSTAPEVKGIQTTIGGNGNLEIALANSDTWVSGNVETLTSTTNKTKQETNVTWGNLIDVSEGYGVNLLSLAPAQLAYTDDTKTKLANNIINAPKYGSDGRVSELASDILAATYNGSAFAVSDISTNLAGSPSVQYAGHFIANHMSDYGNVRYEMGYASAIATVLFILTVSCNKLINIVLKKVLKWWLQ